MNMKKLAILGTDKRIMKALQSFLKVYPTQDISLEHFPSAKQALLAEHWGLLLITVDVRNARFFELYYWLTAQEKLNQLPCIFIIEPGQSNLVGNLTDNSHAFFLEKPFRKETLLSMLKGLLQTESSEQLPTSQGSLIGKTIGSSTIEREVGRGGMGVVYLGYQKSLNRQVAIKVMQSQEHEQLNYLHRLQKEAKTIASIKDQHIVQVYEAGFYNENIFYITMEYLKGQNLETYLAHNKKMPEFKAMDLIKQAAKGLQSAHANGVIHRDIKPSNLIIDQNGHLTLTDFGVAKTMKQDKSTQTGVILGTPHYFSPEQAMGEQVDLRTDIYSLGIVFYELLTGSVPFEGETAMAAVLKRFKEPFPDPRALVPTLSPSIVQVLHNMTQMVPAHRYADCYELLMDLEALQIGARPLEMNDFTDISEIEQYTHNESPSGQLVDVSDFIPEEELSPSKPNWPKMAPSQTTPFEPPEPKHTPASTSSPSITASLPANAKKSDVMLAKALELALRAETSASGTFTSAMKSGVWKTSTGHQYSSGSFQPSTQPTGLKKQAHTPSQSEFDKKLQLAKMKYIRREYKSALQLFRECQIMKPDDPTIQQNIEKLEKRLEQK